MESWIANLYTSLPSRPGERRVVSQLKALPDAQLHLWCGLNFIPGVKDTDLLLWHERCGIFNIEIKAVPLREVKTFGWAGSHCTIQGRPADRGPVEQAHQAMYSLLQWLRGRDLGKLYLTSVAAWPCAYRSDWNRNWDDVRICGAFAESMLFKEDFDSDPAALVRRLRYVREHPNRGEKPKAAFVHSSALLQSLRKELEVNARAKPSPSDIERLESIEKRVDFEERERVPPQSGRRWIYSGKVGTGKTFRLLRIGSWHAEEGSRVLYLCFNKVLASDMRRLLNLSDRLNIPEGLVDAYDVFDFLGRFLKEPLTVADHDHDEWAELIGSLMRDDAHNLQDMTRS